uniref:TNFR-Cys domain-containing protein n=1 Tax=Astyanax mexicanus TaxID=7994 RepID=A0A3B1JNF9_ASTMX
MRVLGLCDVLNVVMWVIRGWYARMQRALVMRQGLALDTGRSPARPDCDREELSAPCRDGFYTEFWNYVPECLPCDPCEVNQEEIRPCTRFHNRVCQCKPGYFCKKHTVCSLGKLVISGTNWHDNICVTCDNITTQGM